MTAAVYGLADGNLPSFNRLPVPLAVGGRRSAQHRKPCARAVA